MKERDALTAHADCHPAALCDGPEQARVHTRHLALCGEAQSKQYRERHDLEDRIERQVQEIARLNAERLADIRTVRGHERELRMGVELRLEAARERCDAQEQEIERLRSEAGYHDAADVIKQLTEQVRTIEAATWEAATWEAAATLAAEMRSIPQGTTTSTRELWRNEMAGDLEQIFRARAAAQQGST
jgi:hypothetical protein